jgi:hypothetical protein
MSPDLMRDTGSESIEIPSHLSLPPGRRLARHPLSTLQRQGTATIDREPENDNVLSGKPTRRNGLAGTRRAGWLALTASPTFALMAWIAANDARPMAFCSLGSSILPIDGMTTMYVLMSLFHLSPWLKLASGRPWARTCPITKGD